MTRAFAIFCTVFVCLFFVVPTSVQATGVAGQCGTADGASYGTAPTRKADMCARGNPTTATSNGTDWVWTCQGSGSAANASCAARNCTPAPPPPPPQCAFTNDPTVYTAQPAYDSATGCTVGSFEETDDDYGYFRWSCRSGTGPGSIRYCSVFNLPPENGQCRTYAGTYDANPAHDDASACISGTLQKFNDIGDLANHPNWRWKCMGRFGGTHDDCQATKDTGPISTPQCHPTSAQNGYFACQTGLVESGWWSDNQEWWCGSYGGAVGRVTCSPVVAGVCDNNRATFGRDTSGNSACKIGNRDNGAYSDTATEMRWACTGLNGGADSPMCSAPKPIDGDCISYASGSPSQPATNTAAGCNIGTYRDVPDTATSWRWVCDGTGYGELDLCTAQK